MKTIESLFTINKSFVVYPFRIIYAPAPANTTPAISILVSVPKKKFKRAVKRNAIRRKVKEAYRLHKSAVVQLVQERNEHYSVAFLYLERSELPYATLEQKMVELLDKWALSLQKSSTTITSPCAD